MMTPQTARRLSSDQINRALENIAREIDALQADQIVLMTERDERMEAMRPKAGKR